MFPVSGPMSYILRIYIPFFIFFILNIYIIMKIPFVRMIHYNCKYPNYLSPFVASLITGSIFSIIIKENINKKLLYNNKQNEEIISRLKNIEKHLDIRD